MSRTSSRSQHSNSVSKPCYRCGGAHSPESCRFKAAKCHACGKIGHTKGPVYRIPLAARRSIKLSHSEVLLGQNHSLWDSMMLILAAREILYTGHGHRLIQQVIGELRHIVRYGMGAIWWGTGGGGHAPPPTFSTRGDIPYFIPPPTHTHILRMMP